jgi:hypothetical protein
MRLPVASRATSAPAPNPIQHLLSARVFPELACEHAPGFVVIIPTFHSQARLASLRVVLESIARQGRTGDVTLLVCHRDLPPSTIRELKDLASASGLVARFVEGMANVRGAAQARNDALSWLARLRPTDPALRRSWVVFCDDDAAMLPGTLDALEGTANEHAALAVVARSVAVDALTSASYGAACKGAPARDRAREKPHALPNLWRQRTRQPGPGVDLASLIAFSGEIATKTACLLVRAELVLGWTRHLGKVFVGGPHGSGEDLMFSLAVTRHGKAWRHPGAVVLDLAPPTRKGLWAQRLRFGRDHAHLSSWFREAGWLTDGITILDPTSDGWVEGQVAPSAGPGIIVNAPQLREVGARLYALAREDVKSVELELPAGASWNSIAKGCRHLMDTLRGIDAGSGLWRERKDLPAATLAQGADSTRWSTLSQMAQLAGNILGQAEAKESSESPAGFLYGLRQAVTWPAP